MLDLLALIPALGVTAVMAVYAFEPLRADCLHRWAAWWSRFPSEAAEHRNAHS
jgi:hypothetical protein